jgi:hypothetical protein
LSESCFEKKNIDVMFKKSYEDGFQFLRNYQKWKIWIILHKIKSRSNTCLDIFGGHFVNLTLFWPKISRKVQNGLDQKGDVLEKNVIKGFFLELDVESMKNINFEILDPG